MALIAGFEKRPVYIYRPDKQIFERKSRLSSNRKVRPLEHVQCHAVTRYAVSSHLYKAYQSLLPDIEHFSYVYVSISIPISVAVQCTSTRKRITGLRSTKLGADIHA